MVAACSDRFRSNMQTHCFVLKLSHLYYIYIYILVYYRNSQLDLYWLNLVTVVLHAERANGNTAWCFVKKWQKGRQRTCSTSLAPPRRRLQHFFAHVSHFERSCFQLHVRVAQLHVGVASSLVHLGQQLFLLSLQLLHLLQQTTNTMQSREHSSVGRHTVNAVHHCTETERKQRPGRLLQRGKIAIKTIIWDEVQSHTCTRHARQTVAAMSRLKTISERVECFCCRRVGRCSSERTRSPLKLAHDSTALHRTVLRAPRNDRWRHQQRRTLSRNERQTDENTLWTEHRASATTAFTRRHSRSSFWWPQATHTRWMSCIVSLLNRWPLGAAVQRRPVQTRALATSTPTETKARSSTAPASARQCETFSKTHWRMRQPRSNQQWHTLRNQHKHNLRSCEHSRGRRHLTSGLGTWRELSWVERRTLTFSVASFSLRRSWTRSFSKERSWKYSRRNSSRASDVASTLRCRARSSSCISCSKLERILRRMLSTSESTSATETKKNLKSFGSHSVLSQVGYCNILNNIRPFNYLKYKRFRKTRPKLLYQTKQYPAATRYQLLTQRSLFFTHCRNWARKTALEVIALAR